MHGSMTLRVPLTCCRPCTLSVSSALSFSSRAMSARMRACGGERQAASGAPRRARRAGALGRRLRRRKICGGR
jgi:hypothetical protein